MASLSVPVRIIDVTLIPTVEAAAIHRFQVASSTRMHLVMALCSTVGRPRPRGGGGCGLLFIVVPRVSLVVTSLGFVATNVALSGLDGGFPTVEPFLKRHGSLPTLTRWADARG